MTYTVPLTYPNEIRNLFFQFDASDYKNSGLTNLLGQKARHYCAIRIANTYSEDTLKKIIRRVAFEHGINI